ncbi:MAG: hypothetical protein LC777_11325, partial [Actinobacteria bacterium]|nr:hypothetical protein [Actinomycetota bacterium]
PTQSALPPRPAHTQDSLRQEGILPITPTPPEHLHPDGLLVPGGGDGGPYYLIRPKPESGIDIHYLIALLSHPVIDRIVVAGGRAYRGGYYVHRKQFLKDIPVPRVAREAEISRQAAALGNLVGLVQEEPDDRARLSKSRLRDARRKALEDLVADVLGLTSVELTALDE